MWTSESGRSQWRSAVKRQEGGGREEWKEGEVGKDSNKLLFNYFKLLLSCLRNFKFGANTDFVVNKAFYQNILTLEPLRTEGYAIVFTAQYIK